MTEDMLEFKKTFEKIKAMGWVRCKRRGSTGVGYTFEKLLNMEENSLEIPDYKSLEIKTQRLKSKSYINLFNAIPDGDYLFNSERLRDNYGYPDRLLKNYKVMNCDVFANKLQNLGTKFKIKLKIDWKSEKIKLVILNNCLQIVDSQISWSFELLKEKLNRKLNYLAFITADNKYINGCEYFKYMDLTFYKLKNFDKFIELIDNGIIKVAFKIGVIRHGVNKGKINNHGTGFSISKQNLTKLYDNINIY